MFVPTDSFPLRKKPSHITYNGENSDVDYKMGSLEDTIACPLRIVAFDQYEHPEVIPFDLLKFRIGSAEKSLKGVIYHNPSGRNALYLSLDISSLLNPESVEYPGLIDTESRRNALMQLVIFLSDRNFATYLSRSGAFTRYRKLYGGLLRDGVTAGSGIAAFFSPFTSLGLSMANISSAANSIDTGIDKQMLSDFAIEILHTSALEQRLQFRAYLMKRMKESLEEYPLLQALSDLSEYDQRGNLLTVIRLKKAQTNAALLNLENEAFPGLHPKKKE